MIIESISEAYKVRSGTTAVYPTRFLWLVVHGKHDLPWYRRLLRRLKGIVSAPDDDEQQVQRLEERR